MQARQVYFIGIGGIGMSALARWFKRKGACVSGYDRSESELTRALAAEGIDIHYDDDARRIPADRENTLVIYTPAVPEDFGELKYVRENGYRLVKRSRALGQIAQGQSCLAVAGTHGKTTTSTLLAHILTESGEGCSAFLGGLSKNYSSNLLISDNNVIVAEADEYDRSFLQLFPQIAVITAMDPDHLDIYGDTEHYRQAFHDFASQVKDTLILKYGLSVGNIGARTLSYGFDAPLADFHAENAAVDNGGRYSFTLVYPDGRLDLHCGTPGRLNAENCIAAAAAALVFGISPTAVASAVNSYKGVCRRLDLHVESPQLTYLDDYAHHPDELKAAIVSIRDMFPGRKLTAVFQPHLYSRTRDFAAEFAQALSAVDKLILLEIYPAREEPLEGVTSELIFKDVKSPEKVLLQKDRLLDYLKDEPLDVLVTFGAGNIDRLVGPISEMLKDRC